jgi:hypothetical protein
MLLPLDKDHLHHAYLIDGEDLSHRKELNEFIELVLERPINTHPDVYVIEKETFAIDDAHDLSSRALQSAFLGGKKIFVVHVATIQHEAQHALLKTVEEPRKDTHFFFLVANAGKLLPTLRSRMYQILLHGETSMIFAHEFVKGGIVERMKFVEKIYSKKDTDKARELFDGLLVLSREKKYTPEILSELVSSRSYLEDRGSSLKILLENLALTFPLEIK